MKQSHRIPLIILTTHSTRKWHCKSWLKTDEGKGWMMDKPYEVKIWWLEEYKYFFFFFKVKPTYSCLWLLGMVLHQPCPYSLPLVLCFKKTPFAWRPLLGLNSCPFSTPWRVVAFHRHVLETLPPHTNLFSIAASLYSFPPHLCPMPTFGVLLAFPLVWPNTFTSVFRKFIGSTSSSGTSPHWGKQQGHPHLSWTSLLPSWRAAWPHPWPHFVLSSPVPHLVPAGRQSLVSEDTPWELSCLWGVGSSASPR